jgi:thiol-disulfide isomerase/thioredoxin
MPLSTLLRAPILLALAVASLSAADPSAQPITISNGDLINVSEHLVPGKTVVFGFFSEFSAPCPCEPCSSMGDPLAKLQQERDDLVVVMVNVDRAEASGIDWNSPVAQQFSLRRLPHFKIFGPDGALVAQDDQKTDESPALVRVHKMVEALAAHQKG